MMEMDAWQAKAELLAAKLDRAVESAERTLESAKELAASLRSDLRQMRLPLAGDQAELPGVPAAVPAAAAEEADEVPSVEAVTRVVNGEEFSQSAGPQVGTPDTQSAPSSYTEDDSWVGVRGMSPAGALSEEVPSEK